MWRVELDDAKAFFEQIRLAERERVRLGTGLEEGDLQRPLADRVVLTDELIQAALAEYATAVCVNVHAV